MTKLSVQPIDLDKNDESLYITKEIRTSGQSIKTPIVAYNNNLIRSNEQVAPITRGLNEIYCEIETQKTPLKELVSSTEATNSLDQRIKSQLRRASDKEINLCILECNIQSYPSLQDWEFVLDTAHANSEIVPVPNTPEIVSNIIGSEKRFEEYLSFLKQSIDYLRVINEKPIMGVIPTLSYTNTRQLMEFYIDYGINAFYVDFSARNMITAKRDCMNVLKVLKRREMIESSFLYAYNLNSGRLTKTTDAVAAKDIIAFGFGFNAFGRKHKRPKVDASVWRQINTIPNKVRIFNKKDYGYYRVINSNRISEFYPPDSCFTAEQFNHFLSLSTTEIRRCEALFNTEQLGMEAFRLRQIIKDERPIDYLLSKSHVRKEDIKTMKNFKAKVSSGSDSSES